MILADLLMMILLLLLFILFISAYMYLSVQLLAASVFSKFSARLQSAYPAP